MQSSRAGIYLLLLSLSALLILSGCITPQQASRCTGFSNAADRNGCYNHFAVWDQEPYLCYSITDSTLRGSCLEDANSPAAQQRLIETQSNPALQQPPAPAPTPAPTSRSLLNGTAPTPGTPEARIADCMQIQKLDSDACTRQMAMEMSNISLCNGVRDGGVRAACVSNVALTTKNSSSCATLTRDVDRQICTHYASGA